ARAQPLQIEVLLRDLVELGRGQKLDGVVQHGENVLASELANLRAELVTVDLEGLPCLRHLPRAQRRNASIHSAPSGGGSGKVKSRIETRCCDLPREHTATICSSSVMSIRSTVTSTPSSSVLKGSLSRSSSRVKKLTV